MTDSAKQDPSTQLSEFFNAIWGKTEGFVYLPVKSVETGKWRKVFYEWPQHETAVIRHVLSAVSTKQEVYFAPAIFSKPDPHRENVKGSNVIWVDFDGNAPVWPGLDATESPATPDPAQESTETPASPQHGTTGRTEGIPAPSIRVQSSDVGHEHLYWILEEFTTDGDFIDNANRSLAYKMDADTSGWDKNQILRPPFTTNFKREKPVTIKEFRGQKIDRSHFDQLPAPERVVSDKINTEDLPPVDSLIAKYQWDEQHFDLFKQASITTGDRSSALMQMAYFCCEVGMTDVEAYAILENADSRWGKFVNRSDRKQRLLDAVNRARIKHPVPLGDLTFAGLLGAKTEVETKYLYGYKELLDSEIKIEWAIPGLIEQGGMGLIASLPGVGKTQVTLRLAMACALGKKFLHWHIEKRKRILFLSLEMNHAAIKEFMQTMAGGLTSEELDVLDNNFKVLPLGEALPLDTPEGRAFLESFLNEYKPDALFIDSMGKVSYSELTEEKKIKELNGYYARLRKTYGFFIFFIHHNRKPNGDNKKPTSLSDLYGNQYIAAETSVALNLWKTEDDSIEVSTIKSRLVKEGRPFYIRRTDQLDFELTVAPVGKKSMAHEIATLNGSTEGGENAVVDGKPGNGAVSGL